MIRCILILVIFSSCAGSKQCATLDSEFVKGFNRRLLIVQQLQERSAIVGVDDYGEAIWYLSKITGIFSHADISSTLGYRDKGLYESDVSRWRDWLRANRCNFTVAKADSIINRTSSRN